MVSLGRKLLKHMVSKATVNWYTRDQICRGKDSINDILPLTVLNIM